MFYELVPTNTHFPQFSFEQKCRKHKTKRLIETKESDITNVRILYADSVANFIWT